MKESGVDPVSTRQSLRNEIMKQTVIQQEVDRRIYFGLTVDELKKYFEANKARFFKPENVVISEIYLSFAGKNEADIKAKAMDFLAQIPRGAGFPPCRDKFRAGIEWRACRASKQRQGRKV